MNYLKKLVAVFGYLFGQRDELAAVFKSFDETLDRLDRFVAGAVEASKNDSDTINVLADKIAERNNAIARASKARRNISSLIDG